MTVTTKDIEQQEESHIEFNIPNDWLTGETQLIKRCDYINAGLVDLHRRAMEMITWLELLREGIEEVQQKVPTYKIVEKEGKQ